MYVSTRRLVSAQRAVHDRHHVHVANTAATRRQLRLVVYLLYPARMYIHQFRTTTRVKPVLCSRYTPKVTIHTKKEQKKTLPYTSPKTSKKNPKTPTRTPCHVNCVYAVRRNPHMSTPVGSWRQSNSLIGPLFAPDRRLRCGSTAERSKGANAAST